MGSLKIADNRLYLFSISFLIFLSYLLVFAFAHAFAEIGNVKKPSNFDFSIKNELYFEGFFNKSVYAKICNLRKGKIKPKNDVEKSIKDNANPDGCITFSDGVFIITYWYDSTWDNRLTGNTSFNTVYDAYPGLDDNGVFEVVSVSDEEGTIRATNNHYCYYFSYDSLNDHNKGAINIKDWVDYLEAISNKYGKIGRLTIFAHGDSGFLRMSDSFELTTKGLKNNNQIRAQLKRLRNILNKDAHILLFACRVAKDGSEFIQELANLTGAVVHANKEFSGEPKESSFFRKGDWSLQVVAEQPEK